MKNATATQFAESEVAVKDEILKQENEARIAYYAAKRNSLERIVVKDEDGEIRICKKFSSQKTCENDNSMIESEQIPDQRKFPNVKTAVCYDKIYVGAPRLHFPYNRNGFLPFLGDCILRSLYKDVPEIKLGEKFPDKEGIHGYKNDLVTQQTEEFIQASVSDSQGSSMAATDISVSSLFRNIAMTSPDVLHINPGRFAKGRRYFDKEFVNIAFVNRRSCARKITNMNYIMQTAAERIFTTEKTKSRVFVHQFQFEDHPNDMQMLLAADTDIMIQPHGAGLGWMSLMPRKSVVVELLPEKLYEFITKDSRKRRASDYEEWAQWADVYYRKMTLGPSNADLEDCMSGIGDEYEMSRDVKITIRDTEPLFKLLEQIRDDFLLPA